MADVTTPTQRIIPGAPPPTAVSKSQKKKRKTNKPKESSDPADGHVDIPDTASAAPTDEAPKAEDVKEVHVAPQLTAQPSEVEPGTPLPDGQKASPAVDLLNKRMKPLNKKIVRHLP